MGMQSRKGSDYLLPGLLLHGNYASKSEEPFHETCIIQYIFLYYFRGDKSISDVFWVIAGQKVPETKMSATTVN